MELILTCAIIVFLLYQILYKWLSEPTYSEPKKQSLEIMMPDETKKTIYKCKKCSEKGDAVHMKDFVEQKCVDGECPHFTEPEDKECLCGGFICHGKKKK